MVYKSLFATDPTTWFEQGSIPTTTIEQLAEVLHYYDIVVKRRNSRRPPLAVELTFAIIRYYANHHKICTTTKEVMIMKELLDNLLIASSTKIFKILNQIVDLNQKSKFALSFSHILKQLDFKHPGLLAHVRNGFFHQEMPAQSSLTSCFESLLVDLKRLFWDKVFAWYVQVFCEPSAARKLLAEFGAQTLDKATLNDVDEYSDRCLAQQDLQIHLAECSKVSTADSASGFIKHKVKGLHRKTAVALLVAIEAEKLAKEQLISVQPLSPIKTNRLEQLLAILQQILEIFQSNANMHSVLKASPLKETVASLLSLLQISGNWQNSLSSFERFLNKTGSSQANLMVNLASSSITLGKREKPEQEDNSGMDIKEEPLHGVVKPIDNKTKKLKLGQNLQKYLAKDPQSFHKAIKTSCQLAN